MKLFENLFSSRANAQEKVSIKRNNVPMTPAMLSRKYEEEQCNKYGLRKPKKCVFK